MAGGAAGGPAAAAAREWRAIIARPAGQRPSPGRRSALSKRARSAPQMAGTRTILRGRQCAGRETKPFAPVMDSHRQLLCLVDILEREGLSSSASVRAAIGSRTLVANLLYWGNGQCW